MDQRAAVVLEALSFEGTAYHHMGRLKIKRGADGAVLDRGGVDCAQLPFLVYYNAGLIPFIPLEYYPEEWFVHRSEERFLATIEAYAHQVEEPKPGDLAIWKFGRCFSHSAIVIDPAWPAIIHSVRSAGCVLRDSGLGGHHADKPRRFYSLW
ncbi:MAG: hypothetical protein A3E01_09925 [Gammaproteobacteria bacterium RIFCSPHIGHO2_12_FULL_63_22]|nr:MAG: hypothetical protein A3E01_09925 [Gammaproteobacteria bacterium RIFCSPHIGHO2_12_FULL_63_22]